MVSIENVASADIAAELDELLWDVLWKPLGLPRDVRHAFRLEGDEYELLAREEGRVVGGLVAVRAGQNEMEIRHLAVASHARMRGIGRGLVKELFRIAGEKNCRRIHTIARRTSADFFRTLGFRNAPGKAPEHPTFREHGISFELLEKMIG